MVVAAALILVYAFAIEPNMISITKTTIELDGTEEPLKIVFISDVHAALVSDDFLRSVVERVNAENPDVILLGGDYVDWDESEISRLSVLGGLRAETGVYAVLGNHDYRQVYGNGYAATEAGNALAENVSAKLEGMGFTVLRNENAEIAEGVVLAGMDDFWAQKNDYGRAANGTEEYPVKILLVHNQDAIAPAESGGWNLILVGHTHCGQVRLPLVGSVPKMLGFMDEEYDNGYYDLGDGMHLYATCGIGVGPRFLAPPEITVITIS
ncbi:metallophosphoesterase [Candidatus Micrarchaeota archaeon]|nr:metallophosphoesterase [Candidatus Micrarchaeota archaeon]